MNVFRILTVSAAALISSCFTAQGAQRSEQQALQIAQKLLSSDNVSRQDIGDGTSANAATLRDAGTSANDEDEEFTPFYIYKNEAADGFVILSGSDRMNPVLGYSDGPFVADSIPTAMSEWLQLVREATALAEADSTLGNTRLRTASASAISPLLGNIAWSQDSPYNDYCPTTRSGASTVVGCVATAGAMVMYYHRYPTTGAGSHTNAEDESLTIDFSEQTYDYDLMFDTYDKKQNYTTAQLNEVAKLCYHCGVASDMQYGTAQTGSGTSDDALRRGLVENFCYDPLAEVAHRCCYTYDEWTEMMVNELEHGRPIIYGGTTSSESGHCFVLDGIDTDGLFHVNWGWGGSCNGYFDIVTLDYDGSGGFSIAQSAIVQLAPAGTITDGQYIPSVKSLDETFTISSASATLGSEVSLELPAIYNFSFTDLKFKAGLAFVQDGEIVASSTYKESISIEGADTESGYYNGLAKSKLKITVPSSLADGSYRMYVCAEPTSGDMEGECGIIRFCAKWPNYYDCTVANGKATFSRSSSATDITVSNWSLDEEEICMNEQQTITCDITNNSTESTLVAKFFLSLKPSSNSAANTNQYVEADDNVTLAPSATQTLSFDYTFTKAGNWTAALYVFYVNIDEDESTDRQLVSGETKTFTVSADGTEAAKLTLTAAPTLVTSPYYGDSLFVGEPATFQLTLRNDGEAYANQMQIQLFRTTTSTTVYATVTANVSVPANASANTYTVSGVLTKASDRFSPAKSGTTYYARATYYTAGSYENFSTASGVTNRVAVKCYSGTPTTSDIISISLDADATDDATYDLFGRRLPSANTLAPGLYVRNGKKQLVK